MAPLAEHLLALVPDYRARVWGGQRLKASSPPVGEAWIAFEGSRIRGGRYAGRTVGELTSETPVALLGRDVAARYERFPLLVKLLDAEDWLSVQVHPDDEQARRLVGPDAFGKTEAWYFLDAEPGARILAGVKPGTTSDDLAAAIRGSRLLDVAAEVEIRAGDGLLVPAGMLHALGPGLLLYEVQQSSDTTYRAWDWDRPATPERKLHIEESLEVTAPTVAAAPSAGVERGGGCTDVLDCQYFDLDLLRLSGPTVRDDTAGRSFHILTVVEGAAEVRCGAERQRLGRFETVLVAGSAGAYELAAEEPTTVLRSAVPTA